MGPKPKKKEVSLVEKEEIIAPIKEQEEESKPPYFDLRYTPLPVTQKRRPEQKFEKILVRKRKRRPSTNNPVTDVLKDVQIKSTLLDKADILTTFDKGKSFARAKDVPNFNNINIMAVNSQPMSKWFGPGELPMIPPPIAILRRAPKDSWVYTNKLNCSFRKENGLLRAFEKEKQKELEMENSMMKRTGKTRQNLLLRKHQYLPHIERVGQEITCMRVERTETPEVIYDTDMFSEAARSLREKNGIRRTLNRRERGFNLITDWIGCPEVTDLIAEKLNLRADHLDKINESSPEISSFIPRFEKLGLVGLSYDKVQKKMKETLQVKAVKEVPKDEIIVDSSKLKYDGKMYTNSVFNIRKRENSPDESKAGLIIGQIILLWTRDSERANKRWVIDLGCVSEIGKDAVSSITMENIGTTALHFKWEKIEPENVFDLKKYSLRRFGFDCWGGAILPGEVFRIPVLYKCIEPGFYSEDWRLITLPVLENGAEIITRLWGITRQYDPYRHVRQEIDDELEKKMANAIVEHRVTKIVDYLPLKEIPLREIRFPLVHLGPDLFHLHNPWLQYHCASVYCLGKLAAMTENKRNFQTLTPVYDKSGPNITYFDESTPDLIIQQKVGPDTSNKDIFLSMKITGGDLEDYDKQGLPAEAGSFYYDEANTAPSISKVKRLIEELLIPEAPDVTAASLEPAEDEVDYDVTASKNKRPLAVNLTNPDISVDQIRENIRNNIVDAEEIKEAHFLIMTEKVSRLLFKTDMPMDNWKNVVAQSLLCSKIDAFSEFAMSLKNKCCEGQLFHEIPEKESQKLDSFEDDVEEEMGDFEDNSEISFISSQIVSDVNLPCLEIQPRRILQYVRYQDQYYSRLCCRMYSLLAEYVEELDTLMSQVKKRQLTQEEVVFTRVRNIPMNLSVEEVLNAPLPPKWVKMAQRLDLVVRKNRANIESVNEGL